LPGWRTFPTLSWNEFIYALAFIQSTDKKTVPVTILTKLVTGDVYQWDR
jgi:multiple sugar transport system permease protein